MSIRTISRRYLGAVSLAALAAASLVPVPVSAQSCTITIGMIISQTGGMAGLTRALQQGPQGPMAGAGP